MQNTIPQGQPHGEFSPVTFVVINRRGGSKTVYIEPAERQPDLPDYDLVGDDEPIIIRTKAALS